MRRVQDGISPWSFFLPTMLAVGLGVLLAAAAQWAISSMFADGAATTGTGPVAPAPMGIDAADAVPGDAASLVEVGTVQAGDVPMLPGPITAMRDGAARACINDTIAMRRSNGWEQGLDENAPLRCRASSP